MIVPYARKGVVIFYLFDPFLDPFEYHFTLAILMLKELNFLPLIRSLYS